MGGDFNNGRKKEDYLNKNTWKSNKATGLQLTQWIESLNLRDTVEEFTSHTLIQKEGSSLLDRWLVNTTQQVDIQHWTCHLRSPRLVRRVPRPVFSI